MATKNDKLVLTGAAAVAAALLNASDLLDVAKCSTRPPCVPTAEHVPIMASASAELVIYRTATGGVILDTGSRS
jgi:hypothetical protein